IENDDEMSAYGTAEYSGAIVTEVEEGSAAEKAGLLPGDVIVSWNGRQIRSASDLDGCALDPEAYHAIRVLRRQGETVL
nr:PDZ domain-containing protein [Clostridiales bacterium]